MQFAPTRALLACAFLASVAYAATIKQQPQQQQQKVAPSKLKRDAGLSFGSGLYHGPSHKYLPPSVSSGYESTYATLHGNGLGSSSGFDFASLDTEHNHQPQAYHHYSHQPHSYQSLGSHHGHGRPVYISSGGGYHQHRPQSPKVETYIVQTSSGSGASHGHHQQQSPGGYKYAGHGGGGGGGGSSSGSGFLSLLSGGGGGGGQKHHGGSSSTYLLASPAYSGGHGLGQGHSHGHGLALGHGHGLSLGHGHGLGHASISGIGGIGGIASLGSLGSSHGFNPHQFESEHGQEQEQHSGYNYEQHFKQQPLSSYGVPLLPGYEHSQHSESAGEQLHHVQEAEQEQEQQHKLSAEQQPPAYALGHKGLGHFSYTSSKPLALNTDIHQLGGGHENHQSHNELIAELSKAPFKPSAFLGAKHEPSAGYDYATPTQQYLQPPTSTGYDYPAPAVLYGAPGQSGDSATPIFESPESTYLPPASSYH